MRGDFLSADHNLYGDRADGGTWRCGRIQLESRKEGTEGGLRLYMVRNILNTARK